MVKRYFRKFFKWYKFLIGKSILHVPQGPGILYSKFQEKGYYNDLRNKVLFQEKIDPNGLPYNILDTGKKIYFPTTIAQYGLGAYDLYLETGNKDYLRKSICCAKWLIDTQDTKGGWEVWNILNIKTLSPYSSMTQGESSSLLFRVGLEIRDDTFLGAAEKALELMLLPINKGGTARFEEGLLYLEEFPKNPPNTILNGWIFSIFGLYDGILVLNKKEFEDAFNLTVESLSLKLSHYDAKFWSYYDLKKNLASPFYHNLHLSLLKVLFDLTYKNIFIDYYKKWKAYKNNIIYRSTALIIKIFQKLKSMQEEVSIIE